jgi:hypothetical protein
MKRRTSILISILAILLCLAAVPAFAEYTDVNATSKNGITYELSDDNTYYIVKGWEEQFPSLTVESEINGLPVKEIKETAFMNNRNLLTVRIPNSVTVIGEDAFKNCENLTTVHMSDSVTFLPANCFENCSLLKNITLPSKLETIDDRCFMDCVSLGKLKIPASVKTIGYDVFLHCESILLDVSENDYASDYAEINNVNTDFKSTTLYFILILFGGVAIGLILFVIIYKLMKAHIKKHPKHNPAIYIGRFFGLIGRGIAFISDLIKRFVLLIIKLIFTIIEFLQKKLKEHKEQKKKSDNTDSDKE